MSVAEHEPAILFDLQKQSAGRARTVRTLRRLMVLLLFLTTGLFVWFVGTGLKQGVSGFQWVVIVVVPACLSLLIGEFVLVLWKTNRGPLALAIRADGLEFAWPSGGSEVLPWSEICRGLTMYDNSGVELIQAHTRNLWELRRWNRPIACISREAFDAIILAALRRGMLVREFKLRSGPFRWTESRAFRFSSPRPMATV